MDKPIIFLDFDGVVETIYWDKDEKGVYCYNVHKHNHEELNNKQAIGWLNELYARVPYDVVITSTWRMGMSVAKLQHLLIISGFNPDIKVIGKTPVLFQDRGMEIQKWMDENNYKGQFIIVDDDADMNHLLPQLIQCDTYVGFSLHDFQKALQLLTF